MSTIVSSLIGFASGGWGSFAAILALIGSAIFLYWKYKQAVQEKAKNDGKDQAAVDEAKVIGDNQQQSGQIAIDESENQKALTEAMKKIEAAALHQKADPTPDGAP